MNFSSLKLTHLIFGNIYPISLKLNLFQEMFVHESLPLMKDCFMSVKTCYFYRRNPCSLSVLNTDLIGQALLWLKGSTVLSDILSQHETIHFSAPHSQDSRVRRFSFDYCYLQTKVEIDGPFSTLTFITTVKNVPIRASKKTVTHRESCKTVRQCV